MKKIKVDPERERLRQYYLALTIAHEKRVAKFPKWKQKPAELVREYAPPADADRIA